MEVIQLEPFQEGSPSSHLGQKCPFFGGSAVFPALEVDGYWNVCVQLVHSLVNAVVDLPFRFTGHEGSGHHANVGEQPATGVS